MIARTWRDVTKAEDADTYLTYLHETGLSAWDRTVKVLPVHGSGFNSLNRGSADSQLPVEPPRALRGILLALLSRQRLSGPNQGAWP
jgi:hypothetical protein